MLCASYSRKSFRVEQFWVQILTWPLPVTLTFFGHTMRHASLNH